MPFFMKNHLPVQVIRQDTSQKFIEIHKSLATENFCKYFIPKFK